MSYDLLVIGGGIHGAGIARDAAGRGLSVLLVEKDSLAAHTSSASSKLVHGGLRYLEYFHLRLVRESLMERERLLAIAPHLVERRRFVLPYRSRLRPAWAVRLGLFLYDWMGRRSTLGPSEGFPFAQSPYGEPLQPKLRYGFAYTDCTTDDSRLVILNAKDAAERGAHVRVGHRFVRAAREGRNWHAEIRDEATGAARHVNARAIVNAAGPWVSEVLRGRLGAANGRKLRLVKGSHIVVPRLYEGEHAYAFQHTDRRLVFVMPYLGEFTLVGTTDVPWTGDPGPASIEPQETEYLCEVVSRGFKRTVVPTDVRWSFAGIRALQEDGAARASAVTRDYALDLDAPAGHPPVLTIVGGKLTTYRIVAEEALALLEPHLGRLAPPWTGTVALPGGNITGGSFDALPPALGRLFPYLTEHECRRLARAYGTRAMRMLDGTKSRADLGENFGGGLSQLEVDYLRREEWARTAQDVLWRHSKAGLWATPAEAQRLRAYLGR